MAGAIFNTVPPLAAGAGMKFDGERFSTAAAPRNLLDNSDFRKPVNQRGQRSYTRNGYTIDRWAVRDGQLNIGDGFISVKNAYQLLQIDTNKVYTLAAKTAAGVVCFAAKPNAGGGATLGNLQISMAVQNSFVQVLLTNATGNPLGGAYWAALYEGEYTAENLPDYQPKGYGAELAECRRYFYRYKSGDNGAYVPIIGGSSLIPGITFSVEMRISPSVYNFSVRTWTTIGFTDITNSISSKSINERSLKYIELTNPVECSGLAEITADFVADL